MCYHLHPATNKSAPVALFRAGCGGGWVGGLGGHANEASLHLDCYFLVAIGHTA